MRPAQETQAQPARRSGPAGTTPTQTVILRPGAAELQPARWRRRRQLQELSLSVGTPILLFALWQFASVQGWIDNRLFPAPADIWAAGTEMIESGRLQHHVGVTVRRVIIGYTAGCLAGVLLAVALSLSRHARAALEPTLYAVYTVPKLAILPMLLLIFGIGETPMIVLIAIASFFLTFIPTLASILAVPAPYREVAASFGASRWQLLRHVLFPATLPQIFVSLRVTAGYSMLVVVAVEFVQSREGIGYLIWNSWSLFRANQMYVGIVVVALTGVIFTTLVKGLGRWLTPWSR